MTRALPSRAKALNSLAIDGSSSRSGLHRRIASEAPTMQLPRVEAPAPAAEVEQVTLPAPERVPQSERVDSSETADLINAGAPASTSYRFIAPRRGKRVAR